tara:strand:- start:837 stop:1019 length:183 start_codon:yes stop_codon:yes gene_type:complete
MKTKWSFEVELEDGEEDLFVDSVRELKDMLQEYKELKELRDERLQGNDKPVKRTTSSKKN